MWTACDRNCNMLVLYAHDGHVKWGSLDMVRVRPRICGNHGGANFATTCTISYPQHLHPLTTYPLSLLVGAESSPSDSSPPPLFQGPERTRDGRQQSSKQSNSPRVPTLHRNQDGQFPPGLNLALACISRRIVNSSSRKPRMAARLLTRRLA